MKHLAVTMLFFVGCIALNAQEVTVTGKVTDEEGIGLSGATVYAIELGVGTTADMDGNYELTLPTGKVLLEASYVGFSASSKNVEVSENTTVNFVLSPGSFLDEVVVYSGSKKAEKLTSSTATVITIGAREIDRYAGNPAELLARKKGVDYFRAGIAAPAFNIRGFNSNFNSKNLQVVDNRFSSLIATGLPMGPLTTTIKEDTEQVELILGPNATLYGPNAHNGLIHTITKDPRKHQGLTGLPATLGSLGMGMPTIREDCDLQKNSTINGPSRPQANTPRPRSFTMPIRSTSTVNWPMAAREWTVLKRATKNLSSTTMSNSSRPRPVPILHPRRVPTLSLPTATATAPTFLLPM